MLPRIAPAVRRWVGVLALVLPAAWSQPVVAQPTDGDLRRALLTLDRQGDIDQSLQLAQRSLQDTPDLSVAHLFKADLYALLGGVEPPRALAGPGGPNDMATREARLRASGDLQTLRSELQARAAHLRRASDALPLNLLEARPGVDQVILVDIAEPRVFVLSRRNGAFAVTHEFYASVGIQRGRKQAEGDMRTPVGIYHVRAERQRGQIRRYHGAFAWELNYPNRDDVAAGRTGSHIWIHGVPPDVIARPPHSTEGCIVLSNRDLLELRRVVERDRSMVLVVDGITWVTPDAWRAARDAALVMAERQARATRASAAGSLVSLGPGEPVLLNRGPRELSVVVPEPATGRDMPRVASAHALR